MIRTRLPFYISKTSNEDKSDNCYMDAIKIEFILRIYYCEKIKFGNGQMQTTLMK